MAQNSLLHILVGSDVRDDKHTNGGSDRGLSELTAPVPRPPPPVFVFDVVVFWVLHGSVQTFVTMNIPRGDPLGTLSVGLYSVAIMMTYPLQLFPAIKCLEG